MSEVQCHPRGEMCLSCTKLHNNCSHLPFNEYYVIEQYEQDGITFKSTRCKEFSRADAGRVQ